MPGLCQYRRTTRELGENDPRTGGDSESRLELQASRSLRHAYRIHEDLGETAKAIERFSDKQLMVDQVLRCETLTIIYLSLGEKDKAIDVLEDLLMLNNSNFGYYFKILEAPRILVHQGQSLLP
jgi:hypothetical protein